MTKLEALAKDCIENHTHRLVDKPTKQDIYLREESIFIQGYRQCEKRIATLEKENAELKERADKADLDSVLFFNQLCKAKKIILKLYNAGRDVLMCRAEEKAYDNLSNAINDKSIEQFLSELEEMEKEVSE
jgi:hypothetical protein